MKKVVLTLACAGLTAGLAFSFSACSSSTTSPDTGTTEAGPDARKEAGVPVDDGGTDAGQTFEQCNAACEAAHPAGLKLDVKIDDCWTAHCQAPCVDGTGGFDAGGAEAGDGGDGGALACTNDVQTGDTTCDSCTKTWCCASWDGCFNDTDCAALNDCRSNCPDP
jgi:hypothetical protein